MTKSQLLATYQLVEYRKWCLVKIGNIHVPYHIFDQAISVTNISITSTRPLRADVSHFTMYSTEVGSIEVWGVVNYYNVNTQFNYENNLSLIFSTVNTYIEKLNGYWLPICSACKLWMVKDND